MKKSILFTLLAMPLLCSCGGGNRQSAYEYYSEEAREHEAKAAQIRADLQYGNDNNQIETLASSYAGRQITKGEYRRLSLEKEEQLIQENKLKAQGAKTAEKQTLFGRLFK